MSQEKLYIEEEEGRNEKKPQTTMAVFSDWHGLKRWSLVLGIKKQLQTSNLSH